MLLFSRCLCNIYMPFLSFDNLSLPSPLVELVKGKLALGGKRLPLLGKEFSISFELYCTSFKNGYHSILHLTMGGDCCGMGTRIPGIWAHDTKGDSKSRAFHISHSINGNGNTYKVEDGIRMELLKSMHFMTVLKKK